MGYRDELAAAKIRSADLEQRVLELENDAAADARLLSTEGRMRALEAELARLRNRPARSEQLSVVALPIATVLVPYLMAIVLAIRGADAEAWLFANAAVALGLVDASGWSWGRVGLLWPWFASVAGKLLLVTLWAQGWWQLAYSELDPRHSSGLGPLAPNHYFFWYAPLVMLVIAVAQGVLLALILRAQASRGLRRLPS